MADLPLIMGPSGAVPNTPAAIQAAIIAQVLATNPGYTANLPASLIEDVLDTEVAGIAQIDQARVDAINSFSPFGANAFALNELGQIYGVPLGEASNTSVFVVFSGTVGFAIAKGFVVGDGTYQYALTDGGVIGAGGTSPPLQAVATVTGSFPVPAGTVQQLATSVPTGITLTVNNPTAGTPGGAGPSETQYRAQVLQAGLAAAQGFASFLRTQLENVPGVQARLVSVLQAPNNTGWEILCGGSGDPYQIGQAILDALFYVPGIVGSQLDITNVSAANPCVITTNLNHNFTTGQSVTTSGINGPTIANGIFVVTVLTPTTFSIPINTTSQPAYTSGGVFVPNPRNITVNINDYPNVYAVTFVNPPQQTVTVSLTWNTTQANFVSQAAVAQAGQAAIVAYINSIVVGQPINIFQMQEAFLDAISDILAPQLVSRMVWAVSINGVSTPPTGGTEIIPGDIESFFATTSASVTVTQG